MPKMLRDEFPSIIDIAYREYIKYKHVSDIMTRNVITIGSDTTVYYAAKVMGELHIGSLVVEEGNRAAGIFTERDYISRVLLQNLDPKLTTVKEVMRTSLTTIKPTATIKEAAREMIRENSKWLLILEHGKPIGIVTASDLVRALPEAAEAEIVVDDFMTKNVVSVPHDTLTKEAVEIMGRKNIGSVLVTRGERFWGIFTERDLLSKVASRDLPIDVPVENYASTPLITIPSGMSIHRAALTMAVKHIRRLPVERDGEIIGIITARDLIEAYAR
ncbi:MAG: hypothetical protein DRJ33_01305 [Candidatus Methanomethylicota archaeon]|uniref:CBS domain-containing protein n=1 Tax=Thermoproteota archaeon TaxID=2056631 RepID=A0A497F1G4_9CREN|nr:MAG: hypothetical protein DRJ33_01305 [Candidatus Verstraetearchaeota archaeon]